MAMFNGVFRGFHGEIPLRFRYEPSITAGLGYVSKRVAQRLRQECCRSKDCECRSNPIADDSFDDYTVVQTGANGVIIGRYGHG